MTALQTIDEKRETVPMGCLPLTIARLQSHAIFPGYSLLLQRSASIDGSTRLRIHGHHAILGTLCVHLLCFCVMFLLISTRLNGKWIRLALMERSGGCQLAHKSEH